MCLSLILVEALWTKHRTSRANLEYLNRKGCLVLHKVDVHDMHSHPVLIRMRFDVIVFNFPHAGRHPGLREKDIQTIR